MERWGLEKLEKFEYLENKMRFLDEIKSTVFEGLSLDEKIKNSRHKL